MNAYSRSLVTTAALLVAAILGVLVSAAPPQQPEPAVERGIRPAANVEPPSIAPPSIAPLVVESPVSMSDPDGQELILEDLSVRAAVHGMLSLTEMEFRFRNPTARRIEGRFSCTLPSGAAISRFAKDVNGNLMEGEVVERLRANQVYEQFLHQMRDPALLEQDQGNRFSARIFPIEPNAPVRLILSYTRLLPLKDGQRTYTLPLRGISKISKFAFRAVVAPLPGEESTAPASSTAFGGSGLTRSSVDVLSVEERDFTPSKDIELTWKTSASAPRNRVLRAGDSYLASFRPAVRTSTTPAPNSWLIYVDTSASAAEGSSHRIRAVERMLGALPSSDRVRLFAFDNHVASLRSGTAGDLSASIGGLLRARLFLGGTDLAGAIRHAARAAADNPNSAVVFVSDFAATVGDTSASDVLAASRSFSPNATVHAVILGGREDAASAKAITAGRGRVIRVPFSDVLDQRAREAASSLRVPLGESVTLSDAAAEWVYPSRIDDVQPGDEVLVLGRTRAGAEPAISLAGTTAAVSPLSASTFEPLLEREAYRAYLEFLSEREANEPSEAVRKALASEQVRISVEQRVVIPRTTMLVLESEWDYQRFNIDRRSLAAILTIDAGGIARIDRTKQQPPPVPMPMPVPQTRRERSAPIGGVSKNAADLSATAGAVAEEIPVDAAPRPEMDASRVAPVAAAPPASAPMIAPGEGVFRRVPESRKVQRGDWTSVQRPSAEKIEKLFADLKKDPRDRDLYNQLSDALVLARRWDDLRRMALSWQPYDPDNPQVYEVLGLADEQLGREDEAARAWASLIEVAPGKTELLQRAGMLLVRVGEAKLAEAPLRRALELRPDRVNSYRHLALMLWLDDRPEEAARILESATKQTFPNWYGDAQRVVREELAYVYRSWLAKSPAKRAEIEQRARDYNADLARRDALRVSLAWETDANDVDLHVVDPAGDECFYSNPKTSSGLELYGDITQGLGPEVIRTSRLSAGTYHVGVRYFAAGPMGVSRGLVVVIRDREGSAPAVAVHPFRLVQGGGEIRYVAAIDAK